MNDKQPEQWQLWMLARFPRWVVVVATLLRSLAWRAFYGFIYIGKDMLSGNADAWSFSIIWSFGFAFAFGAMHGIGYGLWETLHAGVIWLGVWTILLATFFVCMLSIAIVKSLFKTITDSYKRVDASVPMREKKKEQD